MTVLVVVCSGCQLYGFGANSSGMLGTGTHASSDVPVPAAISPGWSHVDASIYHSCGIDIGGRLYCWGNNTKGELGLGSSGGAHSTPTQVGAEIGWSAVSAGGPSSGQSFTCGIRDGGLYCWGHNGTGQLGQGTAEWDIIHTTPTRVGTADDWQAVTAGAFEVCGIRGGGELWCWGIDTYVPTRVGTADDWTGIDIDIQRCGIRSGTELWCWGDNTTGAVGTGSTEWHIAEPTRVRADLVWSGVATGAGHTCGVADGALYCWGANETGQLGQGYTTDFGEPGALAPLRVGPISDWNRVAAGGSRSCAIRAGGRLYCWGNGSAGDASGVSANAVPTRVDLDQWATVTVGDFTTLGIRLP